MTRMTVISATAALALAGLAGGCGSSSSDSASTQATTAAAPATTTTAAAAAPAAGNALTIVMKEFSFTPKDATATAGSVKVTAKNVGSVAHELVLLKTDADPAALPKKNGEVDESKSVGEISDVAPGQSKSKSFKLAAGSYVMVCALPGHYEGGMYGSLTVK